MAMRRASALAAALILTALLASCRSAPPATPTVPSSTVPSTTTTSATPEPTLVVATWLEPAAANWWEAFGAEGSPLEQARELGATPSLFAATGLEPLADLATLPRAVPRPDGSGWVVEQRIEVGRRWSDGAPIRASDLVFYFETVRSMGLDGVHASHFPPEVTSVEAVDEWTVRIRFAVVPGPGLWPGTIGLAPFVPSHFWGQSGATDVLSHQAWSGVAAPRATEPAVEWALANGREDAYRMLIAGTADFVYDPEGVRGLDPALVEELAADPTIELVTSVRAELRVLAFNQRSAPLDDPAFRLALATVVDRAAIASDLGLAVADGFTRPDPPGESSRPAGPGTFDGERLDRESRIDRALDIFEQSGYPAESIRPFEILVSHDDPVRVAVAQAVAERLSDLDLDVAVVPLSPDELAERVLPPVRLDQASSWDMAILGWRPAGPDPGEMLVHLFHSAEDSILGGGLNVTGFDSAEFDGLADRYRATSDLERAGVILDRMELVLAEEVPQLPLYRDLVIEAARAGLAFTPAVGGVAANPASWPYPRR